MCMSLLVILEFCEPFQSADSGLFSAQGIFSSCYLITGSPPSVSFSSSRTPNILKLDPPGSVLQVFCLFPHEFYVYIFLLYTWRLIFLFGFPGH